MAMGVKGGGTARNRKKGSSYTKSTRDSTSDSANETNEKKFVKKKDRIASSSRTSKWKSSVLPLVIIVVACSIALRFRYLLHYFRGGDTVDLFWSKLCATAACHPALIADGRSKRVSQDLSTGTILLNIPHSLTIWDIDAMRDPTIQKQFFFPPTSSTRTKRSGASYLTVYLARLWKQSRKEGNYPSTLISYMISPLLKDWLQVLPTYEDFRLFHPVLWTDADLRDRLGDYTAAYEYVTIWRMMFETEYKEFADGFDGFSQEISLEEYLESRLIVGTRAALVRHDEHGFASRTIPDSELINYKRDAAVDFFEHGFHILVPGFDMFDHDVSNIDETAVYHYNWETSSFQTLVERKPHLPAGSQVTISYGSDKTDPDLLARYGFVTGDGYHPTDISLAIHHPVLLSTPQFSRLENVKGTLDFAQSIAKYLQFDDGYSGCVVPMPGQNDSGGADWNLKVQKFQFLHRRSSLKEFWFVSFSPRRLHRNSSEHRPPQFNMEQQIQSLQYPASSEHAQKLHRGIVSTCRVISLTSDDFGGKAAAMLEEGSNSRGFYLDPDGEDGRNNRALEYRTWNCVQRLANGALDRSPRSLVEQIELVRTLDRQKQSGEQSSSPDSYWKWTIEHVRLGEMQSLEVLTTLASSKMRMIEESETKNRLALPAFKVRDSQCSDPSSYAPMLFDTIKT